MSDDQEVQESRETTRHGDRDELVADIRRQWYFVFALLGVVGAALAAWTLLSEG